jgi:hypothetical protein
LPRNLILSQEWRIGARPVAHAAISTKPVAYQSNVSTAKIRTVLPPSDLSRHATEKHQTSVIDVNGTNSHNITSHMSPINPLAINNEHIDRSSSTAPIVSDLIKVYTEVTATKLNGSDPVLLSNDHHDGLTSIVRDIKHRTRAASPPLPAPSSNGKRHSNVHDNEYEEIKWNSLVVG